MKKIKKFLESKLLNTWNFKYYDTIKKAKITKVKDIEYVLSRCGNAIQCFNKTIKKNKELALIAVNQNGHAIHFLDESIQTDPSIINLASKTGRTDTGYQGKKLKFILPDISYWHVKFNDKKYQKKEIRGKVKNLKLNDIFSKDTISFYTGETINGVPNGYGVSETYDKNKMNITFHKKVSKAWINNYQKNFLVKKIGYNLLYKFIGEWKNGMMYGYGEFIEYCEPEYILNKDGSPKPMNKYKGNFVKGKKEGMFEVYQETGGGDEKTSDWTKQKFKNDY